MKAVKEYAIATAFIGGLVAMGAFALSFLSTILAMIFGDADDLTLIAGFETGAMEGVLDVDGMSAAQVNGMLDAINAELSDNPDYYGLIVNDADGNLVASRVDDSPSAS